MTLSTPVQQVLDPHHHPDAWEPAAPPAGPPSKEPTRYSLLASGASARARIRHAELNTHYTRGRLAAWDELPCALLPPSYAVGSEAAMEWMRGFNDGMAERRSIRESCTPVAPVLLALVALLALASWAGAAEVTADVYALGVAYHARAADAGAHDLDPGAGLGVSVALAPWLDATGLALAYEDSVRRHARAVGVGLRAIAGDRHGFNLTGALLAGRLRGSGYDGDVILPVVGVGYDRMHVEGTYNPGMATAAAWLRVSWVIP